MPFIQKIISILIVNLYKRNLKLITVFFRSSLEFIKHVWKNSRYDSSLLPIITTTHCICFTTSSLPICKNSSIITIKTIINHRLSDNLENLTLLSWLVKDTVKIELMIIFCIWKFIPCNLKFDSFIGKWEIRTSK